MAIDTSTTYGAWTGADIERFLTEARIPLRLSLATAKGPLIVPVWYEYAAGRLWSCSPEDSLLVRSLRAHPAIAFDISTNDLPYRGVRGRGTASCERAGDSRQLERLLRRYLGGVKNNLAIWLLGRTDDEALIGIDIDWITSWDFSERMSDIEPISRRHDI
jgi:nitroimidazol reductase NimA-like FMN-containing flavoprotein (pyridoxamine 5'-phosphate oxidase superfamily)